MKKKIKKIINTWNPIEIYPLLEDEYCPEVREIESFISNNEAIDPSDLADCIDKIFIKYFGNTLYVVDKNKTITIAKRILNKEI